MLSDDDVVVLYFFDLPNDFAALQVSRRARSNCRVEACASRNGTFIVPQSIDFIKSGSLSLVIEVYQWWVAGLDGGRSDGRSGDQADGRAVRGTDGRANRQAAGVVLLYDLTISFNSDSWLCYKLKSWSPELLNLILFGRYLSRWKY